MQHADTVRKFADAFAERDHDAAFALLHEDVVLAPLRAQLEGGSYSGHDGYLEVLALFDEDWENLQLVLDELHEGSGMVVAVGHLIARGRVSGVDLDVPLALRYEFRDDRISRIETYSDASQALEAAGIDR